MKKKTLPTDDRKLMDRLIPDPSVGRLLGILATTYEMQPEFIETDFLPTLFGLGAWDDRSWSSRIGLEKHLAELDAAVVLMDARPYRGRPRSLRVDVQPVSLEPGRIQHAKILLAIHEHAIRLTVGSANLTEPGYRRNREVVAVLTASATRPSEAQMILTALREMNPLLLPWLKSSARQLHKQAIQRLQEWTIADAAAEEWFQWGGGDSPLWRQFIDRWPVTDRINRITIVSPFWSEERDDGPVTTLLTALRETLELGPDFELQLLTEAAPDQMHTCKPKLPESFQDFDARSLGIKAAAHAVDPRVPPKEVGLGDDFTGTRDLHAKVVLFEGGETSLAYLGSANFTRHGWGFLANSRQANVEAGLIIRRTGPQRVALRQLIPPTTGEPVPLNGAAAGQLAISDQNQDEPVWPSFLLEVLLVPSEQNPEHLDLQLVLTPAAIDGEWRITHLEIESTPCDTLFSSNQLEPEEVIVRLPLTEQSLSRILRDHEVRVIWWLNPAGRLFPVNVAQSAKSVLPVTPGSGQPDERSLLAYYQGRITWEDLFPDPQPDLTDKDRNDGTSDGQNGSAVDTSRIQSYVIRDFVEALKGINDDLKRAAQSTPACMRMSLLGSVSPVALAKRVLETADTGDRTPAASGFQLVEILGCLDAAFRYDTADRFREEWLQLVKDATEKVASALDQLDKRFPGQLSQEFRRYAKAVRKHHQDAAGTK